MRGRVCALVEAGSVPGRNPLLPPLGYRLAAHGLELVSWDPTDVLELPAAPPPADLYLIKGDHPTVLTAAGCLADLGAACLNTFEATAGAADKARTLARLRTAGVPVPESVVVGDRARLAALLAEGPRFVKPVRGAHGVGAALLQGEEAASAGEGPWLVQQPIPGDGHDIKVYGVGDRVAVRRARFVPGAVDQPREVVTNPDPWLEQVARTAAGQCGLTCFGADFIDGPDGPVLVDLNAFPGYRGVSEGPDWVAEAVISALGRRWR